MKTVVVLVIFFVQFIAFEAFSQRRYPVNPFEDYRECYTGFKTHLGDTVHQAKFESVYYVDNRFEEHSKYCWVVEEQGRFGILNMYGDVVFPSKLDTVYLLGDSYRMFSDNEWLNISSNGNFGVIDFDGNEILPMNYQHIEHYVRWLKVRNSEGKVGLLDTLLQVDVPFEYDDVFYEKQHDFTMDTTIFYDYFLPKKNGAFGMLKSDLTPILPFEFQTIDVIGIWEDYVFNTPYILTQKDNKKGLYNYDGTPIIPNDFESIELKYDHNYLYKDPVRTATAIKNERYIYFNVETGAQSEPFYTIRLSGGKAIAENKNGKWSVIDTNGSVIGSGSRAWTADEETLHLRDSIVQVSTSSKGNQKKSDTFLYHYGNREFSTEPCHWLMRMELDGENYCWSEWGEKITVYDAQLRSIKSFEGKFSKIMEYLEESGIPYILPIAVLENNDGFFGGFNARGNEVIPQKYTKARVVLRQESHKNYTNFNLADHFEFSNDSSIAYYSVNGELIRELNFRSITPAGSKYFAAKNADYSSLLDHEYNVVLDSCRHIFHAFSTNSDWTTKYESRSVNYGSVYAIRNQKCFMEIDEKFVQMDSSAFDFKGNLQLAFNMLIDQTGSIVSLEGAKIKRIESNFVVETRDSLQILSLDGTVHLRLGGVLNISTLERNLIRVNFQNGFQGIYSLARMKWEIAPESQSIQFVSGYSKSAKYCILRSKKLGKWQFYSGNGDRVSDIGLDFALSYIGRLNLVVIDGEIGVMTSGFNLILPAEYDYISQINNTWFLQKDKQWYLSTERFTTISEGYSVISTQIYPKGQLVFEGNRVGVMNDQFKEIVTLCSEQELLENHDLAALLYPIGYRRNGLFPIVSEENKEGARMINNRIILQASQFYTTKTDLMRLALQHNIDPKNYRTLNSIVRSRTETPTFFSKSYYSSYTHSSSKNFGDPDYKQKENNSYQNYEWKDGKLVQLELGDLFNDYTYLPHLDSLIVDYLNKNQLYGISCVNLEELLVTAKENFILKPEGIEFLAMDKNRNTVLITYSELETFLKRPEEFKIDE